ncbi:MAG: hypothetical protein JWM27_153 [Gemmatimonadetes bacterium]|nr:hypothetical protein [Gemmatimonadota bacterium]
MVAEQTARWEEPGYSDITVARIINGELEIGFANGDHARVPVSALRQHATQVVLPLEIVDDGLAVRLGAGDDAVEISWVRLRSVTDPSYARHITELDAQESRRLGRRLNALREDRRLSQAELARKVGISVSQVSSIEKGEHRINYSTVRMLLNGMDANLADIAGPNALEVSVKTLVRRAIEARVPREIASALATAAPRSDVPGLLASAFGWTKGAILRGVPDTPLLAGGVPFKAPSGTPPMDSPLVQLGFVVAHLARTAFSVPSYRPIPTDSAVIRQEVLDIAGQVTLASLLDWVWNQGIPVLPLRGTGDFAAAVFDAGDAPTIIIKDARKLAAIWLFDLAHELGHVALGHVRHALIDVKPSAEPSISDSDEQAATYFALELLLPNHAILLKEISADARGDGVRFKFAVERVAARAQVSPGVLAMAAAFALPEIGHSQDRWGSATNLAKPQGDGRAQTLAAAHRRATLERMLHLDAALIRTVVLNESD